MDAHTQDNRESTDRFLFRALLPAECGHVADNLTDAAYHYGRRIPDNIPASYEAVYQHLFGEDGAALLIRVGGAEIVSATPKALHCIAPYWADSVQHYAMSLRERADREVA